MPLFSYLCSPPYVTDVVLLFFPFLSTSICKKENLFGQQQKPDFQHDSPRTCDPKIQIIRKTACQFLYRGSVCAICRPRNNRSPILSPTPRQPENPCQFCTKHFSWFFFLELRLLPSLSLVAVSKRGAGRSEIAGK
jgi:hypothetical protein